MERNGELKLPETEATDYTLVTQLDTVLFNQLFDDSEEHPDHLKTGLLSLDQKEAPLNTFGRRQSSDQNKVKPDQATWFKSEIEPSVGTCLFLEISKQEVDEGFSPESKSFNKRFSIQSLNSKHSVDGDDSDSGAEAPTLKHNSSITNASQKSTITKLAIKGKSEYQIALRKRFTGAKSAFEKVR